MVLIENIVEKIQSAGLLCTVQKTIPYGIQLRLANGAVVNVYNSGRILVQGRATDEVRRALGIIP